MVILPFGTPPPFPEFFLRIGQSVLRIIRLLNPPWPLHLLLPSPHAAIAATAPAVSRPTIRPEHHAHGPTSFALKVYIFVSTSAIVPVGAHKKWRFYFLAILRSWNRGFGEGWVLSIVQPKAHASRQKRQVAKYRPKRRRAACY